MTGDDLISRQAAMDAIKNSGCMHIFELSEVIPAIKALPAIDAVPVVRCKNCRDQDTCTVALEAGQGGNENFFCSEGKRRDNEHEQ